MLPDPGDGILFPVCGLGERAGEWGKDPSWPQSHCQSPAPSCTSHSPCSIPFIPRAPWGLLWRCPETQTPKPGIHAFLVGWALHTHLLGSPSLRPECERGSHGPRMCCSHQTPMPFLLMAPCTYCLRPTSPLAHLLLQALADPSFCDLWGVSSGSVAESTVLGTQLGLHTGWCMAWKG